MLPVLLFFLQPLIVQLLIVDLYDFNFYSAEGKNLQAPEIGGGVIGWYKGVVYLTSPGRPTDIGLQLGKACSPSSR